MFTREARVQIFPFSRQPDGDLVVIGRPETGKFVALPPDAVEVLDHLAAGKTVGEAQDLYREKYGEVPDMQDFLGVLGEKGLIADACGTAAPAGLDGSAGQAGEAGAQAAGGAHLRFHFTSVPQGFARMLFNPVTVTGSCLLAAFALWLARLEPSILPSGNALRFETDRTAKTLLLFLIVGLTVFAHEMGHLLAARAAGVQSRLGIGNRMWVLVAETDLTGLWSLPRRQRYLPLLAGPLVDLVSGSLLMIMLYCRERGWISLPPAVAELARALIFAYAFGLLWQCFFFVRTDLYYVLATLCGCKSLMADTRGLLHNLLARIFPRLGVIDQSNIPEHEMRVIRNYLPVLLSGRILALFMLLRITVPLVGGYVSDMAGAIRDRARTGYAYWDTVAVSVCYLLPILFGSALWMREVARQPGRRRR